MFSFWFVCFVQGGAEASGLGLQPGDGSAAAGAGAGAGDGAAAAAAGAEVDDAGLAKERAAVRADRAKLNKQRDRQEGEERRLARLQSELDQKKVAFWLWSVRCMRLFSRIGVPWL